MRRLKHLRQNSNSVMLCISVLFLVSLMIRLFFTFTDYSLNGTDKWADSWRYYNAGVSFAQGDFYPKPSEVRPFMVDGPSIPITVAVSTLVFSDPIWPVLVLNCLVSALLVFVLYKLGEEIVSKNAGVMLAFWSVFNFGFIQLNHQILKEPHVITLVPLITLLLIYVYKNKNAVHNVILSALLFSWLIHVDERFLAYSPIIVIAMMLSKRVKGRLQLAVLWVIVLIASMIPWTIRNHMQFDEIVILTPRTTSFTSKIWGSNILPMHFEDSLAKELWNGLRMNQAKNEAEQAGIDLREYGKIEKYYMAFYHYWKPVYLKTNFIQYGFRPVKWSLRHNLSGIAFYGIFLPFYLYGMFASIAKKNYLVFILSLIPLFHSLLHTIMIWPLERYRLPSNFIIVIVAIWVVDNYWHRRKKRMMHLGEAAE